METRAHHLLIGIFVLLLVAGSLGFAAWLAKLRVDREFAYYRIYFEGSVTGLSRASDVRFNGVPVGSVAQIKVDPEDPKKVRVTIEVAADTPVRTDTYAQLEWQGLTGASFVQLLGGSSEAAMLLYKRGERPPNIPARKSTVQELVSAAPELVQRGLDIADRMLALLGDDNQAAVGSTLRNLDRFATTLGEKSVSLGRALDNVEQASTQMADAAAALNGLVARFDKVAGNADHMFGAARSTLGRADKVLERDLPGLTSELRETAKAFTRMSEELRGLVSDNREAIGDFSSAGLLEFAKFVEEARSLVNTLSRVTNRIESDPAQFLFGDAQRGYKPR
jgi:phospholipid/cholesterol/gamma-HCH transport system substrate-binding protein